jgi:hypothetical protein
MRPPAEIRQTFPFRFHLGGNTSQGVRRLGAEGGAKPPCTARNMQKAHSKPKDDQP